MPINPDALATARRHHGAGELEQAAALYRRLRDEDSKNAEVWCLLGEAAQALGGRDEAVESYRQTLRVKPGNPLAHNNLGIVLMEQGKLDEAVASYRQALTLQANYPEAHNNLGIALMDQGRLDESVASYRQALDLKPDYPEAWNNLANALARQSKVEEAAPAYRQALRLRPDYLKAQVNLGNLLRRMGRPDEAAAVLQQAVVGNRRHAPLHNELAIAFLEQGKLDEAIGACRQALLLRPDFPEAHNNLGIALMNQGHLAESVALYRQALALQPEYPEAFNNLGNALARQRKRDEAVAAYRRAVDLRPGYAEAHHNLGLVLAAQGKRDEALACYEEAVRLKPHYAEALNNLGNAYKDQGRIDEAIACYRKAVAARPEDTAIHSNLLYALHHHPGYPAEAIFAEHLLWADQHARPAALGARPHPGEPDRGRRLRIGYVSPDFREHVMGRYSEAVIRAHDRGRFEVFCYADVPNPDALTGRIEASADHWRSLVGLSDARAAELILQDRIDVLVDQAGHTGGNRLRLFARKPAPVQVTHFGYLFSTGLAAIDYRLTDAYADPPGQTERFHTETVVRLPEVLWCYPPPPSPEVGPLPALKAGHVTFGCFNNLSKVTEKAIALWSQVLAAVAGSRLVVLAGAGRGGDERVHKAFARHGFGGDRVTLVGRRSREDYFRLHHDVDVALDTFPYTGCNTTADALWMGVPVISLAGGTCMARQGIAALAHVGLEGLVVETPGAYVEAATRLAGDLPRLRELRSDLRERMRRSPLTDVPRFTRHLEEAYRGMWRRWCVAAGRSGG
jgi:predicted O-linked N-acetylglucosamine transferase (SPINDLY family)